MFALLTLLAWGDVAPRAQTPDSTDWHRYLPLEVGNEWHISQTDSDTYNGLSTTYRTRRVVLSEEPGEPGRFVVETTRISRFQDFPPTTTTTVSVWLYDEEAKRVVTSGGSIVTLCSLGSPFDASVTCDNRRFNSSGDYIASVSVGSESVATTRKQFYYTVDPGCPCIVTETYVYGAGIGEVSYTSVAASVTQGNRTERRLNYARIGTEEYGTPMEFPVANEGQVAPHALTLSVTPNPARAATRIRYTLPESSAARLVLYDLLGREVARVDEGLYPAGLREVTLDASRLTPGLYIVHLQAVGKSVISRITVVQ